MSAAAGQARVRRVAKPRPAPLTMVVPSDAVLEWRPAMPPIPHRVIDLRPHEVAVIAAALAILECRLREPTPAYENPIMVKDFLRLHLAGRDRECFGVMFLDTQHRLIAFEVMFAGTIDQTAVHPRDVVRRSLQLNSAAIIVAHNHPSGLPTPGRADEMITAALREALGLVSVRLLDHIVVGSESAMSFAESGLL